MSLPEQLLLSDLLRCRVRCDQGVEHGPGVLAWMHPPVHRLLGWISKPSAFGDRRLAWRLDQLCDLTELEALVDGDPAATDLATTDRLPTLLEAALLDRSGQTIGTLVDAAVELRTGRILHYLVARSDPRLPGSSRWRLSPERIVDQQPDAVSTGLSSLDDLPLARASVRQEFLQRSRRWRDQMQQESERLRDQFQQAGDRFEERLEGWLEEPPWDEAEPPARQQQPPLSQEAWDDWDDGPEPAEPPRSRRTPRQSPESDADPWF